MKRPLSPRHVAVLCALGALLALGLPTLAGAGSSKDSAPQASASAKCGTVETRNGNRAEFVSTVKAKCRTGRRVARRANGKRYRFLGFDCKPKRKRNLGGKVYGCGRYKDGRGQGIGFIYTRP